MAKRIPRSGRPRKTLQVPGAKLSFTGAGVTAHGGFALVARCFEALQLPDLLARVLGRHRTYRPLVATVLQLVTLRLLGGEALSDVAALKGRFFRVVFGWTKIPDATTVGRQLARLTIADRRSLHGWLRRRWAQTLSSRDEVLVSVDPSVRSVYGRQREARRGYNPKRRGAKSYLPLVAYDVDRGEVIDAALRPGNWNLRGLRAFLLRLIEAAGETRDRLMVRLDRGCSGDQTFSLLEAENVRYVAKVETHDRLKAHAAALPAGQWKTLASGAEIASFRYLAKSWDGSRRVVAVRRVERYESDALFAELAVVYSYDFYLTTLAWKKERVVAAYHRGAPPCLRASERHESNASVSSSSTSVPGSPAMPATCRSAWIDTTRGATAGTTPGRPLRLLHRRSDSLCRLIVSPWSRQETRCRHRSRKVRSAPVSRTRNRFGTRLAPLMPPPTPVHTLPNAFDPLPASQVQDSGLYVLDGP